MHNVVAISHSLAKLSLSHTHTLSLSLSLSLSSQHAIQTLGSVESTSGGDLSNMELWNLKILVMFYRHLHRERRAAQTPILSLPLLDRDYIARATVRVDRFFGDFAKQFVTTSPVKLYVANPTIDPTLVYGGTDTLESSAERNLTLLTRYLLWYGVPDPMEMARAKVVASTVVEGGGELSGYGCIPKLLEDDALRFVAPAAWVALLRP